MTPHEVAKVVVDMTESYATQLIHRENCTYRVRSRDGSRETLTTEYNAERINLVLEQGKVISSRVG